MAICDSSNPLTLPPDSSLRVIAAKRLAGKRNVAPVATTLEHLHRRLRPLSLMGFQNFTQFCTPISDAASATSAGPEKSMEYWPRHGFGFKGFAVHGEHVILIFSARA